MNLRFALALGVLIASWRSPAVAGVEDPRRAFASERAAVGGAAWNAIAGIETRGTQISGGAPGRSASQR